MRSGRSSVRRKRPHAVTKRKDAVIGPRNPMKTLVLVLSLAALMLLFAVNRWWRYPDIHADLPRLTSGHIADPRSSGATFRFEGRVTSVRMTPKKILVVRLHDPELDIYLDVPVFPSLGPLPVKPVRGESVRVTGNLGSYGGLPQLGPCRPRTSWS